MRARGHGGRIWKDRKGWEDRPISRSTIKLIQLLFLPFYSFQGAERKCSTSQENIWRNRRKVALGEMGAVVSRRWEWVFLTGSWAYTQVYEENKKLGLPWGALLSSSSYFQRRENMSTQQQRKYQRKFPGFFSLLIHFSPKSGSNLYLKGQNIYGPTFLGSFFRCLALGDILPAHLSPSFPAWTYLT